MTKLCIQLAVGFLRFINLFFRPLTVKNRVLIISRQSDKMTLDIQMLYDCLSNRGIETVVLTKTLKKTVGGAISYSAHLMKQMYHLATAKVVILDGYCIIASILPQKKERQIIQMWHALGAVKKFGWQNVDRPDGHSRAIAEAMKMHQNYDYVLAPGAITGAYFAEAFHTSKEKIRYYGLPRIDFICSAARESDEKIKQTYSQITAKEIVLYVPTFRKNAQLDLQKLIDGFNFQRFALIVKPHFLDKGDYSWAERSGVVIDKDYASIEWLRICDKVITDYSAMVFEAAVAGKDIYIYQPDVEDYAHDNGMNMNLAGEAIRKYVCSKPEELFLRLDEPYEKSAIHTFCKKYIEIDTENCTEELCGFIKQLLE